MILLRRGIRASNDGVRRGALAYHSEVNNKESPVVEDPGGRSVVRKSVFPTQVKMCASIWLLTFICFIICSPVLGQNLPNAPSAQKAKAQATQSAPPKDTGWPRTFISGADTFPIYQPQVDKWNENLIDLYCAVQMETGKESAAKYGVVWFQARTEVDKVNRLVTLDQLEDH